MVAVQQRSRSSARQMSSVAVEPALRPHRRADSVAFHPAGGARPLATRPLTVRPVTVRPVTVRPLTVRPVTSRPLASRPLTVRPVTSRPVASPPATRRSVSPSTYRRRQALAAGAVAALSAVASVLLGALGGGSLTAPERPLPVIAGQVYEVQPGDSFWAIARSLDPTGDPRPLVDRLVADHGSPVLVVGEEIRLPDLS